MATPSELPPLAETADRYWVESRRPLASLVFILPLLVVYEAGVLFLGVQNGADAFMRRLLDVFGFSQHFVLPVLTVCILLGWNYVTHQPWKVSPGLMSGMAAETVLLGVCLRLVLFFQVMMFYMVDSTTLASIGGTMKEAIGFLGAGIYEELLFRLILLSGVTWVMQRTGFTPGISLIGATLITSLLFAAAHHLGASGEPLLWSRFLFRTLAGVFFSIVFIYRGFGIAAGSHAAYDILAWLFG